MTCDEGASEKGVLAFKRNTESCRYLDVTPTKGTAVNCEHEAGPGREGGGTRGAVLRTVRRQEDAETLAVREEASEVLVR